MSETFRIRIGPWEFPATQEQYDGIKRMIDNENARIRELIDTPLFSAKEETHEGTSDTRADGPGLRTDPG